MKVRSYMWYRQLICVQVQSTRKLSGWFGGWHSGTITNGSRVLSLTSVRAMVLQVIRFLPTVGDNRDDVFRRENLL